MVTTLLKDITDVHVEMFKYAAEKGDDLQLNELVLKHSEAIRKLQLTLEYYFKYVKPMALDMIDISKLTDGNS